MSDENAVSVNAIAENQTAIAPPAKADDLHELKAMQQIEKTMDKVKCPKAKDRIVNWLHDKFGFSLKNSF